jgi:hypothetical protein
MTIQEITASSDKDKHKRKDRKKRIVSQPGRCLCRLFFGKGSNGGLEDAETIPTALVNILIDAFDVHFKTISMKRQMC